MASDSSIKILYSFQWLCVPFAWANEHVMPLSAQEVDWIGKIERKDFFFYLDYGLLLVFGGIPWQVSRSPIS